MVDTLAETVDPLVTIGWNHLNFAARPVLSAYKPAKLEETKKSA